MIKKILNHAGFVENETFKETRFLKPPKSTYAIYLDSYEVIGSDDKNLAELHSSTIELYSTKIDPESEKRLTEAFNFYRIKYVKGERTWLESEQLYQVVYDFEFNKKTEV